MHQCAILIFLFCLLHLLATYLGKNGVYEKTVGSVIKYEINFELECFLGFFLHNFVQLVFFIIYISGRVRMFFMKSY